jgi:diguanylate cyclase (GGDEF)-like protein
VALLSVLFGVIVITFLLLALTLPLKPISYPLQHWKMKASSEWRDVDVPFIERVTQEKAVVTLQTSFPAVDADTLIIPRQSGNAIVVWLNGREIYSLGDPHQATANLWNYVQVVPLREPLNENNTLDVQLTSSYFASGLNSVPYLCNYNQAIVRVTFLNWIYNDLLNVGAGAACIIGLILLIISISRRTALNSDFFLGLALLFSVIYSQDSQFRLTTGSLGAFLWAKKTFMLSGYIGSLCFLCAFEKYYYNRLITSRVMLGLTAISGVVILAAPNFSWLALLVNVTNAVLLINLAFVVGTIFTHRNIHAWMLFPATILTLSVLQMLIAVPFGITWPQTTAYVILITVILVGVQQISEFNRLFLENKYLHREKNLDPLTGAMNRRFLTEMPVTPNQAIVMIDLDRFKEYNDRFGHMYGDHLLVQFSELVRKNLRQNDRIVRLGGDEFVLVLENIVSSSAGKDEVHRIMQRIQAEYRDLHPGIGLEFSYGIAPLDCGIDQAIEHADRKMYEMKETKRKENLTAAL